ncbi:fatty acid desaturase [Castellaniella defragrans]|uniref:Fatty acid desaturase Delta-9 fatty acid desaturase n=1 Tax=Castellaniella defragrans (strain DSM 12143 / CCUG 39792 / 65Phen) TaxID=1437824 RepID=W8WYB8_CASD6|nr:fatty acid desaturase [Castellaniella defragrans]CDM24728.1 Fatty acid desaturase; Delta-9 fatty acid desaturase [Castellaniella defragrans 65Phen]
MNTWLSFLHGGMLDLGPWALVGVTLALTHVTIAAVTLYLHRSQAHRGLDLHPAVAHFFRFWLWLTTGMVTREWVAIHRKHHAKCEREGDPHSPAVFGLAQVFFRGAELYRDEAKNAETLARYGHGTPDDWIERHLYSRHNLLGVSLMLILDLALFGVVGLTIWAVQMAWIPFWAAGVVNGLGHAWGYRNFACPDDSTNVVPWGLLIGGEELHNNHHAYGTSAKFSSRWYEFDLGWAYIRILQALGLAQVRRVAPRLRLRAPDAADTLGQDQLQGIIVHRYEVLARYSGVVKAALAHELEALKQRHRRGEWQLLRRCRKWLVRDAAALAPREQAQVERALSLAPALSTVVQMRRELTALWESSSASSEQLLADLRAWCLRARASGIDALEQFALQLGRYAA